MQQLISVWGAMDLRKRAIVIAATLAMFLAVIGLSRMATRTQMTLLYAGLESGAAGEVVQALEGRNVAYEIRGDSIFVDATRRDALRMTLASEGLPANSGKGYELLDGLSGFGTTSQMFDAAYWRAKEGELARTIVASPAVRNARVHIANASSRQFRQRSEPTASVTLTTASGTLPMQQIKAFKFLVASAVPGLAPEKVSVIDSRAGLMGGEDPATGGAVAAQDRAERLKQNVERLLEARVGFGNAVVELNLETATEQEQIRERRFDPESRVAVSTDTSESTNAAKDSDAGGVTVASNLPDGDGTSGGGASSSNNSETRERVNYEVSETTREILKTPGAVKRLTVAVLVDGIRTTAENGTVEWAPRPEAEMENLRELVAGAVGFNEARGDIITLKTMEFEPVVALGSDPASGLFSNIAIDVMSLIKLVILALVTFGLGLFVLRPMLTAQAAAAVAAPGVVPALGSPNVAQADEEAGLTEALTAPPALIADVPAVSDVSTVPALTEPEADPVQRLRDLISERQSETVEILRGWMEEDEEATG
ncbi:flagellar M-ring protein FliF [Aliiroseovarius halocynthiae]|uniref:Flagellar M-ring protein n=1 Tax=Aliiroseovarius halocynthiae TaxID=985055 RepID=A0A545SYI3_9RHOB|nr:flagellar basal-body MS-ring/collar protein FliF [Aliiroseovarius halocynthiae]TQV70023.1 flagellar M-ring protein FliF [Aliiroseovarius halocynthiae]SMR70691.1 flagellar M-ring protein FliF [Aliiroseovarius halocynthiae]